MEPDPPLLTLQDTRHLVNHDTIAPIPTLGYSTADITGSVQAQYRYSTGTVQVWYSHSTGTVQAQYRHSTGTVQVQYKHSTVIVYA